MRTIYIDGLGLVESHFSGVGQYILGIVRGLDQLIDEKKYRGEPAPRIKVVIPRDTATKFKSYGFKHIEYTRLPFSFRHVAALWHRGWLPPIDVFCGRGTYIFPRFVSMPLLFSKNAGLVIFDLSYELHRQYSDEGNAIFLSQAVKKSVNKTQKIITISQNAKREIVDFYGVKPSDVVIANPAVDPTVLYRRQQREIDSVKRKYGVEGDYILALSNLEPRKNLDMLVDAYCQLPKEIRQKNKLLLVGVSGWKTDALFEKIISKVNEGYDIIRPSKYVSDEDKPAIISGAKMLVYPSHYEGFGIPPLEALACGVPVISADNSSLPEVVRGAGALLPSNDLPGLVKTITEYFQDIEAYTKEATVKGPQRAREFDWKKSAQIFLEVAEEAQK